MPKGFNTVILLGVVGALGFSITPLLMLLASLIGSQLSPVAGFATLPIAVMIIGTAMGVWPATTLMQAVGRKRALWLFMLLAVCACLLASYSLAMRSFTAFCVSTFMVGISNASLQQIRFAAMEVVAVKHAATATSMIILSGVLAAFIGPELAVLGKDLTGIEYQGSFLLIIGVVILAALLLVFYQPKAVAADTTAVHQGSMWQLFTNKGFFLAVSAGAVAYIVMSFIMTATPISMHHHYGHSLEDTKFVIQSHIAAMFLPSLLTPLWIRTIGLKGMMAAGIGCFSLTIFLSFQDVSVNGFWYQLVVLGLGWNLLFVAGTAMLPSTYKSGQQFKAQALNDTVVFSTQAMASLSAGVVISLFSWQNTLLLCVIPILLLLVSMVYSLRPA